MNQDSKKIINFPQDVNLTEFKKEKSSVTKYGLPADVKYCKTCVISNQRPNTTVEFKHNENSKKTTINFDKVLNPGSQTTTMMKYIGFFMCGLTYLQTIYSSIKVAMNTVNVTNIIHKRVNNICLFKPYVMEYSRKECK